MSERYAASAVRRRGRAIRPSSRVRSERVSASSDAVDSVVVAVVHGRRDSVARLRDDAVGLEDPAERDVDAELGADPRDRRESEDGGEHDAGGVEPAPGAAERPTPAARDVPATVTRERRARRRSRHDVHELGVRRRRPRPSGDGDDEAERDRAASEGVAETRSSAPPRAPASAIAASAIGKLRRTSVRPSPPGDPVLAHVPEILRAGAACT